MGKVGLGLKSKALQSRHKDKKGRTNPGTEKIITLIWASKNGKRTTPHLPTLEPQGRRKPRWQLLLRPSHTWENCIPALYWLCWYFRSWSALLLPLSQMVLTSEAISYFSCLIVTRLDHQLKPVAGHNYRLQPENGDIVSIYYFCIVFHLAESGGTDNH